MTDPAAIAARHAAALGMAAPQVAADARGRELGDLLGKD